MPCELNSSDCRAASLAPRVRTARPQDKQHGVSPVFKNAIAPAGAIPTATSGGATTCWEMVSAAFDKFGAAPAMGQRALARRFFVEEKGKSFEKLELGEYAWMSYAEFGGTVAALAKGLIKKTGLKRGDRVLVYAETQRDWMIAALACFRQGATVVTAYATLGEEGVATALNQVGVGRVGGAGRGGDRRASERRAAVSLARRARRAVRSPPPFARAPRRGESLTTTSTTDRDPRPPAAATPDGRGDVRVRLEALQDARQGRQGLPRPPHGRAHRRGASRHILTPAAQ